MQTKLEEVINLYVMIPIDIVGCCGKLYINHNDKTKENFLKHYL